MTEFQKIKGHRQVIDHLRNGIKRDKLSHCYLFCGEDGLGKRMVAKAFAQMLLCESTDGEKPCGVCPACVQVERENHPDLKLLTHEKPGTFGVEDVREGLNHDIVIKPYKGPYKIYILDEAELLNVQAQNAILKTIEEPPAYAVIFLLSNNREIFLETILSRSVSVDFRPLSGKQVEDYLQEHYGPSVDREFALCYSRGNIGQAKKLMEDEKAREMLHGLIDILKQLYQMPMEKLIDALRQLAEYKDDADAFLTWMTQWYRDVLIRQMTGSDDRLMFASEAMAIGTAAKNYTPKDLQQIFEAIEVMQARVRANVNFELALEMLLMTARGQADTRGRT